MFFKTVEIISEVKPSRMSSVLFMIVIAAVFFLVCYCLFTAKRNRSLWKQLEEERLQQNLKEFGNQEEKPKK